MLLSCNEPKEVKRYEYLVKVLNLGLSLVTPLKFGPTTKDKVHANSKPPIYFVRHDPKTVQSVHKGKVYYRKPDIVCTWGKNLYPKGAVSNDTSYDPTLLEQVPTGPPKDAHDFYKWENYLTCLELKLEKKKIPFARETYDKTYLQRDFKTYGWVDKSEIKWEPEDYTTDSAPGTGRLIPAIAFNCLTSCIFLAVNENEDPNVSSTPTLNPNSLEPSPTLSSDPPTPEQPNAQKSSRFKKSSGAEQCAENAAEMFFNTIFRCFVINWLIKGESSLFSNQTQGYH